MRQPEDDEQSLRSEVDQEGVLMIRKGKPDKKGKVQYKKPKAFYFNLLGGALYYYKNVESPEPTGTIKLSEMTFTPRPAVAEGAQAPFCFQLANDKLDLLFLLEEEADHQAWVAALEANRGREPRPPLPKEKAQGRFQRITRRTTKNLAGKAVASPLGKRAIRNKLPREITELMAALKAIILKESKSPKKAERVEDNIYRMGVKIYFLLADKKIRVEELLVMDTPFRKALALFCQIRYHVHFKRDSGAEINFKGLNDKLGEVRQLVVEASTALKKLLEPHMKPRNVERIDEVIAYVTDPEVVTRILLDPLLDDELFDLESAGKHYSQFFYYADGS